MKPSEMSDEELTRAVAEEVMGWKPLPFHQLKKEYEGLVFVDDTGKTWLLLDTSLSPPSIFPENFLPLHYPGCWWMVVERMSELKWTLGMHNYETVWTVEISPKEGLGLSGTAQNINLGRAVCEAAIATVWDDQ